MKSTGYPSGDINLQDVYEWLSTDLPAWATRTRLHARLVEREGVVVLTAKDTSGSVGYAIFDKPMSHLHYMETREDCRRRGVASRLWAKMRELAGHLEVTALADTEDGKRRLTAWGFLLLYGVVAFIIVALVPVVG